MLTYRVDKYYAIHSINFLLGFCNSASHLMHRLLVPSYGMNTMQMSLLPLLWLHYNDHAMSIWATVICSLFFFSICNQANDINAKDKITLDKESCCHAVSSVGFTQEFMLPNALSRR